MDIFAFIVLFSACIIFGGFSITSAVTCLRDKKYERFVIFTMLSIYYVIVLTRIVFEY